MLLSKQDFDEQIGIDRMRKDMQSLMALLVLIKGV